LATLYSTLLKSASPAAGVLYTVPAGYVVVLRDAVLRQSSGPLAVAFLVDLSVGAVIESYAPASLNAVDHWQGRQVFEEGDGIGLETTGGVWSARLSGYLLSAP
jgi:hypothetical protein